MIAVMHSKIPPKVTTVFDGVNTDTAANSKSIMSIGQYDSYCDTLGLLPAIKPKSLGVPGIGGRRRGLGTVTIHIPFPQLGIIIVANFLL